MQDYDHKKIEAKWQKIWAKKKVFEAKEPQSADLRRLNADGRRRGTDKFYGLIEFPYPSGEGLHIGHLRSDVGMDVICRKRRMEGFNVLYPIGWDAFGLPTENYAIKTGIHPSVVTKQNTDTFRRQLKSLGLSFDWSREINTTDPKYYKWTQWIFLQLLKHGLAYKKKMPINWCPSCKIGLANEEVVDGKCERCGTPTEKRDKEQWMLAITKYADRLDKDLDNVDFLEKIKIQQRNWIGRSEGVNLRFKVKDLDIIFEMYDSVPQTYMAQTFTVIAPEHPQLYDLVKGTEFEKPVMERAKEMIKKRASGIYEKTGEMDGIFTGRYMEYTPAKRELPIWVASFVVADYGTGVVNCSFHDERDFVFAKKFNIPLHPVAEPLFVKTEGVDAARKDLPFVERQVITAVVKHWSEDKYIGLKWKMVDWDTFITGGIEKGQTAEEAARAEIMEETGYKNIKLIRELPRFHSKFFHVPKNENRFAHFSSFFFQLIDGEKTETSPDEKSKHDVVWLTPKELEIFRLPEGHRMVWEVIRGTEKPVIKNGILTEPEEFKGREWHEVRPDIVDFLVKKGYATRAVNYKLRDWVFSRQHYWGEPIPVVFCERCANRKYNFVFIHGYNSSFKRPWKVWLKAELEKKGYTFFGPELPNSAKPNVNEQADFILKNANISKDTIIIGHSLGGAVMMRVLEKLKGKIAKAVFLDSVLRPTFNDKDRADVVASCDWKFDFKKIKKSASEFVVLADEEFPIIPKDQSEELGKIFDAKVIYVKPNDRHFSRAETEPEVLRLFENNGYVPVLEKDLPVELPKVKNYLPTDTGESPLATIKSFVDTRCPRCGGTAKRETDTMPNWAGSSWYYLAYIMKGFSSNIKYQISQYQEVFKYWLPVNWYNGGMEHTTLHLLYSRFWHKFLFDLGLVPTSEPYKKRTSHGLILAEGGVKMSKSKGNVINPDDLVERFGADSLRLYEMFMGPFDQAIAWNTDGLVGTRRFLEKVWRIGQKLDTNIRMKANNTNDTNKNSPLTANPPPPKATHTPSETTQGTAEGHSSSKLEALLHKTVKKVGEDIENMRFNTAISALMICANEMDSATSTTPSGLPDTPPQRGGVGVPKELFEMFLKILSPFAPHIAEELWQQLGNKKLIVAESWPTFDSVKIVEEVVTIVVQINGKVRGQFSASPDISEKEAIEKAKSLPEIKKWTENKEIKKSVFVKGRLVNLVI